MLRNNKAVPKPGSAAVCTVGPEYDVFRLYFLFSRKKRVHFVFSGNAGGAARICIPYPAPAVTGARRLAAASGNGMPGLSPSAPPVAVWRAAGRHAILTPQQGDREC